MRKMKQKYGAHFDCAEFIIGSAILPSDVESGFMSFLFKRVGEATFSVAVELKILFADYHLKQCHRKCSNLNIAVWAELFQLQVVFCLFKEHLVRGYLKLFMK